MMMKKKYRISIQPEAGRERTTKESEVSKNQKFPLGSLYSGKRK